MSNYTPEVPPGSPNPCPNDEAYRYVNGVLECLPKTITELAVTGSVNQPITMFLILAGLALLVIGIFLLANRNQNEPPVTGALGEQTDVTEPEPRPDVNGEYSAFGRYDDMNNRLF